MSVAERVRRARIAAGFPTGAAFARALGMGTEEVWRIETGRRNPGLKTLTRIADAVHVTIDWLVHGDENSPPSEPPPANGGCDAAAE